MIKWIAVAALLLAACGKGGKGSPRDKVIEAWKSAGLSPSAFTAAQAPVTGGDCATGMVSGLDVMLCVFPTPAAAQGAEDAGYKWVGGTTGSVQAKGSVLVAVADRKKADPTGKTLNQLMKLAPK